MDNQNTIDHPPSPEELAGFFRQAEQNDPRSLLYKRVLVRPKLPVGKLILFLLLFGAVAAPVYMGLWRSLHSGAIATLGALAAVLFAGLLLGKPLLITLVHSYQAIAPDKTRNRCRYEPSCSVYMLQAVEKYGFFKGLAMGLKRWHSCKPPNGGIDLP